MAAIIIVPCLCSAIYLFIVIQRLAHRNILTDKEGLWYAHKSKDFLVPWKTITAIKERKYSLDFLDCNNSLLIRVSLFLDDQEDLKKILLKNIPKIDPDSIPESLDKNNKKTMKENSATPKPLDGQEKDFGVEKKIMIILKVYIILIGLITFFPLLYLIFGDDFDVFHSIMMTLFFGFIFSAEITLVLKHIRLSRGTIIANQEGFRYIIKSKDDALIPWSEVAKIKEHKFLQYLDVLDANAKSLIQIDYLLSDFEILWRWLLEEVERNHNETLPIRFNAGRIHHIVYGVILTGVAAAGLYLANADPLSGGVLITYIGTAITLSIVFHLYVVSVYCIKILDNKLVFICPYSKRALDFCDIKSIEIISLLQNKETRTFLIRACTIDKQYFGVPVFGADTHTVYLALKQAKGQSLFSDNNQT